SYMGAPIGTLTQTLYYYYNFFSPAAGPVFRSTSTHITMPLYNVDETQNLYESYTNSTLGNQDIAALPNAVTLVPNPVKDVLHLENGTDVTAVTVFDAAGRMVLQSALANDIDISPLSAGVYVVNVKSGNKIASLKMIKQ
ncbi:MAG: T9SS type A sorting domain-containing protein, partial [Sphingobacteriales bacterium]